MTLAASAVMLSLLVSHPVEAVSSVTVVTEDTGAGFTDADYTFTFKVATTNATGVQVKFPSGYGVSNPGKNGIACNGSAGRICKDNGSTTVGDVRQSNQAVIIDFANPGGLDPNIPLSFTITKGITNPTTAGVVDGSGFEVWVTGEGWTASTTDVTITPGAATQLAVVTSPADTEVTRALTPNPVVRTTDAHGNPSTTGIAASLDVTVSLNGAGDLSGATTRNIGTGAGNGEVTFDDLAINTVQAGAALTFSAPGLTPTHSSTFAVTCDSGIRVDEKCYDTIGEAITGAAPDATINLDAGTYTERLTITRDVTIQGAAAATTIIQAHADAGTADGPVVDITGGSVTITDVTLRHGNSSTAGGGITNAGTLALDSVTVSDNTTAVDGGGIYSTGVLTVTDSQITGNAADTGGGIHSDGALTVTGSQITGNTATAAGGGIYHVSGAATVSESSIAGNTAAEASAIAGAGTVTATDNWWGAADGPGDGIAAGVTHVPWYTDVERTTLSAAACIDGDCYASIEEAITEAAPGATINLDVGTYTETLVVDKNLTLQGEGAFNTIIQAHADSGSASDRVIDIAEGVEVTIRAVAILHGVAAEGEHGGGVRNAGTLTLYSVEVKDNAAEDGGGIWNSGSLEILQSVIATNEADTGGGIWNSGTLVLDDSSVDENAAVNGGGIANGGEATLTNSTRVEGNTATGTGAGILNTGTLDIENSGVTYGEAAAGGGGIHNDGGEVTITRSYIVENDASAGNGGGILNTGASATLTLDDSELEWNSAVDGGAIHNTAGAVTISESFIQDNSGTAPDSYSGIVTDVALTATHNWWGAADGPGGEGFGAGDAVSELVEFFPWYVDSYLDETIPVACIADVCYASIQEAIDKAEAGDTIDLGEATFTESVTIDKDLTISGVDRDDSVIQAHEDEGDAADRVITITAGTVTIENLALRHGAGVPNGGAILVEDGATLNLTDVLFFYNSAKSGGAIYNTGGTVNLTETMFAENSAEDGGAIYNAGGTVRMEWGEFYDNKADNGGGAIYNADGILTGSAHLAGNVATDGGGIYSTGDSEVTLHDSEVEENEADNQGGGIYNAGGAVTVDDSSFVEYNSAADGGGIYNNGGTLILDDAEFFGNNVTSLGGVLYNTGDSQVTITASSFGYAAFPLEGDAYAIYTDSGIVTVRDSSFVVDAANAVVSEGGAVNATNNWWDDVTGPGGQGGGDGAAIAWTDGPISFDPWCVAEDCAATSAASASESLLEVSPTSLLMGGLVEIIVTVRDEGGNVRTAGGDEVAVYIDDVLFATTDTTLIDKLDGTYIVDFAPGASGDYEVKAWLGLTSDGAPEIGTAVEITVSVAAVEVSVALAETGAGEPVEVTINYDSVNPIPADGAIEITFPAGATGFGLDEETITATVTVDGGADLSDGVSIASGNVATIALSGSAPAGSVEVVFTAGATNPTVLGNVGDFSLRTLDGDGKPIEEDSEFTPGGGDDIVAGPVSAVHSSVTADLATVNANGVGKAEITVTVKDRFGHPVGGEHVSVSDRGDSDVSSPGDALTDGDGVIVFTVTNAKVENLTYTFTADNEVEVGTATVNFVLPQPSAVTSTITPPAQSVVADGANEATIRVTVRDSDGVAVPNAALIINASSGLTTAPDDATADATADANGVYDLVVTSTTAEAVTYTFEAHGEDGTLGTAEVTFTPGPVDEARTTFTANPTSVTTGSNATLTVTLHDQFDNRAGDDAGGTDVVIYLGDPDDGDNPGVLFADGDSEGVTTGDTFTVTYTQGFAGTVTLHAFFGTDAARGTAIGTVEVTFTSPEPPADPDPTPTPTPTPSGTPVPEPVVTRVNEAASEPGQADTPTAVSTTTDDGSTATVNAPANAIPAGGKLKAAAVGNLDELTSQAPPPANVDVALAFVLEAEDADGNPIMAFDEPIALEFTVPAASVPPGATSETLVLAFWNGTKWVEVEGAVTENADGSFTITASVDHFTIFAVQHQPNRGKFTPAPAQRGITLTAWGGGGYGLLDRVLSHGSSVWVTSGGTFTGY
ncbi:MAG: Ig-like domain-containing protein, partial [Dehalococcoidia bacterium]|nr:Ig-like domain-containing protein [Dehalococcoidia bacterium]